MSLTPTRPIRMQPDRGAALERLPGYWRGRAQTCRMFAEEERRRGHARAADALDMLANGYTERAYALTIGADRPSFAVVA